MAIGVFGELPVAVILIGGALRRVREMASRPWLLQPGMHVWQLRLPL